MPFLARSTTTAPQVTYLCPHRDASSTTLGYVVYGERVGWGTAGFFFFLDAATEAFRLIHVRDTCPALLLLFHKRQTLPFESNAMQITLYVEVCFCRETNMICGVNGTFLVTLLKLL